MTTISASSTIGINLTTPLYTSPVSVNAGVTISSTTTDAVYAATGLWAIQNAGILTSTYVKGNGVGLSAGGSVTNAAAAAITGVATGVDIAGAAGIVVNNGNIAATGTSGSGVYLHTGGTVANAAAASISGVYYGVRIGGGAGSVANSGGIAGTGTKAAGVGLYAGGAVTNTGGASITGSYRGVAIYNGDGTVINLGSIAATGSIAPNSTSGIGIDLHAGGYVSNASTGVIAGGYEGLRVIKGLGTVVNAGTIVGTTPDANSLGVEFVYGGSITNLATGTITGPSYGIYIGGSQTAGVSGSVLNSGSIGSPGSIGVGVWMYGGGGVTNTASGVITGTMFGVYLNHGAGRTVVNEGSIAATGTGPFVDHLLTTPATVSQSAGIYIYKGGTVTNAAAASITGQYGVKISGGAGIVLNSGSITGTSATGAGIYLANGGSVTDAGTIIGNSGTAVLFGGTASNLLTLDPGYHLTGIALGSATATDTLELASAASAGALSGLGTQFVSFEQVTIDAGASWTWSGANTITAGGTLTELTGASLTDAGTLTNNGAIMLDPSTLTVGGLVGTGSATIGAGSTLATQGAIGSGEMIAFGGAGGRLQLDAPGSMSGSVTNFDDGETIDLKGVDPASVSYAAGVLSFTGGSFALALAGAGPVVATASADGAAVTLCFCANTMILTPSGERPVQTLAPGDMVTTIRGEARRIAWVGAGRVLATRGRRNAATPIIVRKGALGKDVPRRDLRVTKGHSLYIDDVLIPAEFLVNHRTILWDDRAQEVSLYHIELETHDVLVADGAPAESYRDDGNRWLFRNANSGWHLPPQEPCAPVLTGGSIVDAAWRRLLVRAGPRPGFPTTDDPDLHLLVDGKRVDAVSRSAERHNFRLPASPRCVRIASRSGVPQELGLARDPRSLGVALRQIVVARGACLRATEAEDPRLTDGFHGFEPDNAIRWTDGDAALPASLFDGLSGPLEIALRLGGSTIYPDEGIALTRRAGTAAA